MSFLNGLHPKSKFLAINQSINDITRAVTIGGVTFDSIPEPGAALLGGLGFLALLRRRR